MFDWFFFTLLAIWVSLLFWVAKMTRVTTDE